MLDQRQMDEWDDYPTTTPAAIAPATGHTLVIHDDAARAAAYAAELCLDPAMTSTFPPSAPVSIADFTRIIIAPGCETLSERAFDLLVFLLKAGGQIDDRRTPAALH